jgi:hypothetical protein
MLIIKLLALVEVKIVNTLDPHLDLVFRIFTV